MKRPERNNTIVAIQFKSNRLTISTVIQSIEAYSYLIRQPNDVNVKVEIKSVICVRESTANKPEIFMDTEKGISLKLDFQNDFETMDMLCTEEFVGQLDELDRQLIFCFISNMTLEDSAEKLNTTVGTIRYRLRRMLRYSNTSNRKELIKKYKLIIPN